MANKDPVLLGLDVGTTNIKALAVTPAGKAVAQASFPTPTHTPRPGWGEYMPDELWSAVVTVLRKVTAELDGRTIVSVSVASMGEAGVPLDSQNEALYPLIAWYDARTAPQADWLAQTVGKQKIFYITGLSLQPIFGLCKLLWLKQNEPAIYQKMARWLNVADYIAYRLCGEQATDYSLDSRTMALNIQNRRWSHEILDLAGVSADLFAPLCQSGTRIGQVLPQVSEITGLPTTAYVSAGGHDHVCGSLAAGITHPGMVLNSIGTSETVFLALAHPLKDPLLESQGFTQGAHVIPDLNYIFGALYTSGACIDWFRNQFAGGADYESLIAEAAQELPGSRGVCFLPHFQLASPPFDDLKGRGAFIGLGAEVKRGALFRSILEGIAFDSRQMLDAMLDKENVPPLQSISAIGGGTRNPLLMKIKASVFNHQIAVADGHDSAGLGAALLGGLGAGVYSSVADALASLEQSMSLYDPERDLTALYAALYAQVYRRLYSALRPFHVALYPLREGNLPDAFSE